MSKHFFWLFLSFFVLSVLFLGTTVNVFAYGEGDSVSLSNEYGFEQEPGNEVICVDEMTLSSMWEIPSVPTADVPSRNYSEEESSMMVSLSLGEEYFSDPFTEFSQPMFANAPLTGVTEIWLSDIVNEYRIVDAYGDPLVFVNGNEISAVYLEGCTAEYPIPLYDSKTVNGAEWLFDIKIRVNYNDYTIDSFENLTFSYSRDGNTEEIEFSDNRPTTPPTPATLTLGVSKTFTGFPADQNPPVFTYELQETTTTKNTEDRLYSTCITSGAGSASFPAITYNETGTFTYTICEKAGNAGGITYDTKRYDFSVDVVNNEGALETAVIGLQDNTASFTNSYSATGSITLSGTVTLTGRDMTAGEFQFEVKEDGTVVATGTNTESGTISFSAISYTSSGTHTYTIRQISGNTDNIEYDSQEITIQVVVTDPGNGGLNAAVNGGQTEICFANTYKKPVQPVQVAPEVALLLAGRSEWMEKDTYSFTLVPKADYTNAGVIMPGVTTVTINRNTAGHKGVFNAITFTKPGEYFFTITQISPNPPVGGVACDTATKEVRIIVSATEEGALITDVTYDGAGSLTVTNIYSASGQLTLTAKVSVSGREMKESDVFTFNLYGASDIPLQTKTNTGGTITFDALSYTLQDITTSSTIQYRICEAPGNDESLEYDAHTETVTVTLTENGAGNILAETDKNGESIVFTNQYKTVSVPVHIGWDDQQDQDGKRPDSVTAHLMKKTGEKETEVASLTLSDEERWESVFASQPAYENSSPVIYVLRVNDVSGYDHVVTPSEICASGSAETIAAGFTVTESHIPETMDLTVQLLWDDYQNQDGKRPDSMTLDLKKNDIAYQSVVLSPDQWTETVTGLPVYQNGSRVSYSWEMKNLPAGYSITGSLSEGDTTTFTSTYSPGKTSVVVRVQWNDENDKDGLRPVRIGLQLYADDVAMGEPVLLTGNENWQYVWPNLEERFQGKTIRYTVKATETDASGRISVSGNYKKGEYAVSISGNPSDGYTVACTYDSIPFKTSVMVTKVWEGDAGHSDLRKEVTVQLYADDKPLGSMVKLNANNNWSYIWPTTAEGLLLYRAGSTDKVQYTVKEYPVPDGYKDEVKTEPDGENWKITLTNTLQTGASQSHDTVTLLSADENGTALGGTVFAVYDTSGNLVIEELPAPNGSAILSTQSFPPETLPEPEENDGRKGFVVKEITVPEAYTMSTYEAGLRVKAIKSEPRLENGQLVTGTEYEISFTDGSGKRHTWSNPRILGDLKIVVEFSENVRFDPQMRELIFSISGPSYDTPLEVRYKQFSDFANRTHLISDLIPGTYTVLEKNAGSAVESFSLDTENSVIRAIALVEGKETATVRLKNSYVASAASQSQNPCTMGHDWQEPSFIWTDEYSNALATFICRNDPDHSQTVEASVSHRIILPTTQDDGQHIYTASALLDDDVFTDVKEVSIPRAKDGDYSFAIHPAGWVKGSESGATFLVTRKEYNELAFAMFLDVLMDNTTIPKEYYTVSAGSVIVDLKSDYLETLSAGEHTLRVLFIDSSVETGFVVREKPAPASGHRETVDVIVERFPVIYAVYRPLTGDETKPVLWLAVFLLSGVAVFGVLKVTGSKGKRDP